MVFTVQCQGYSLVLHARSALSIGVPADIHNLTPDVLNPIIVTLAFAEIERYGRAGKLLSELRNPLESN